MRFSASAAMVAMLCNVAQTLLLGFAIGVALPSAAQAQSCNATSVTVNATYAGSALSNSTTVYPTCTGFTSGTTYYFCVNGTLAPGTGGTTTSPYRRLDDGAGNKANWQFYGSDGTAATSIHIVLGTITGDQLNAGTAPLTIVLGYPVQSAGYGTFSTMDALTINIKPTSGCGTAAASFTHTLNYSVVVPPSCSAVTTNTLDFGQIIATTAVTDAVGLIAVTCTNNSPYSVYIGQGQNYAASSNQMKNGASYLAYGLYLDSGRTQAWTTASGYSGIGNGSAQNLQVYGRVPIQAMPPVGSYSDVVVVDLRY